MADEQVLRPPPPPPPPSAQSGGSSAPATASPDNSSDFQIGEEFGTARRNLPPARILLICIGAVIVILAIAAIVQRPKPQGAGSIDNLSVVEVPDQNTLLTAVTVTIHNSSSRPLWIRSLKAQLTDAAGKTFDDNDASGAELDRYGQAFPALKENAQQPLLPEAKIMPGTEQKGTLIASFPVKKDDFDKRKTLAVTIQFYDQPVPVVLTK